MAIHENILEALSELVYVADTENYELLYANESMLKAFKMNRSEIAGRKCYEVIMGFSKPCEFCTNSRLCPGKFYSWTVNNKILGRVYKVNDSLIEYEGRRARLEIASDISDYLNLRTVKREDRDLNKLYRDLIYLLNCRHGRFNGLLSSILGNLMRMLKAHRIGIYTIENEENSELTLLSQRTAKGVLEIVPSALKLIQSYVRDNWSKLLHSSRDLYVTNPLELAGDSESAREFYKINVISSYYVHPLNFEGKRLGLLVIDNPDPMELSRFREKLHNIAALISGGIFRQTRAASLERILYVDPRTGLYNRACFMRERRDESARRGNLGIIIVDLNGLKTINDAHGHDTGDLLLKKTAAVLSDLYGAESCYSFGDDEFAVALPNVSHKTFEDALFMVRSQFAGGLGFTASVGGALGDASDLNHLLSEASSNMLEKKQEFYIQNPLGPRYRPSSDLILQRLSQPHTVRMLIERGDFVPYIQPIYDVEGRIAKGEALVRLNYRGTVIPPIKFIPLLESLNMTGDIDFYMFKKSCEIIKARSDAGLKVVPIATNFSRFTVTAPNFVEKVERTVHEFGIKPEQVFLEVTESIEEREHQTIVDVTRQLSSLGYSVAVDDFGVAYANLLTFANLSMNILKFDKKLIDALSSGNHAAQTVELFVKLAHQRGIKVVAEGVEEERQVELLKSLGFDFMQGFYFSKPLPVEDFIRLCDSELSAA